MYAFGDDHSVMDNQLVCFSLGNIVILPPAPSIPWLPMDLCAGFRPPGFTLYTLQCQLLLSLFTLS